MHLEVLEVPRSKQCNEHLRPVTIKKASDHHAQGHRARPPHPRRALLRISLVASPPTLKRKLQSQAFNSPAWFNASSSLRPFKLSSSRSQAAPSIRPLSTSSISSRTQLQTSTTRTQPRCSASSQLEPSSRSTTPLFAFDKFDWSNLLHDSARVDPTPFSLRSIHDSSEVLQVIKFG
jgi:hypothetical protein